MPHTPLPLPLALAIVAVSPCSCLSPPDLPEGGAAAAPVVRAFDARGDAMPRGRLPRRPRLEILLPVPPSAADNVAWLLSGRPDAALLVDLDKLPLNAEHQARKVATRQRWTEPALEIEPLEPLLPGAAYILAVPRSAYKALPQSFTSQLLVDDSPQAGAALRATFPPDGATAVPTDLAFALITFDGSVEGSEAGIWLEDERGLAHPGSAQAVGCADYDHAAVSCVRWRPDAPLQSAAQYTLRSGRALRDARTAPVAELYAHFATQRASSTRAPDWQRTACGIDEQAFPIGCALVADDRVELALFQNASVRVVGSLGEQRVAVLPTVGGARLRFTGLSPAQDYDVQLSTYDERLATEQVTWHFHTAAVLPSLAISEVNADPKGREPDQEFVELWNYGDDTAELSGLLLGDNLRELGTPIPESTRLEPGARALLVSDDYDPTDDLDPRPAPGSLLVRMGKALTRGGLANAGEVLYLRTRDPYRLSSAPSVPAPRPGQCLVRVGTDPRSTEPGSFELAAGGCTPGR